MYLLNYSTKIKGKVKTAKESIKIDEKFWS